MCSSDLTRDDLRALPLESRNLWSQRPLIHVQDGILVRDVHTNTQLVVPTVLQNRLFDVIHSGPLAAQLGAERMLIPPALLLAGNASRCVQLVFAVY